VFPQSLLHFLLEEAGVEAWDSADPRAQTAMFHLGQLSRLVTGLETPGWTRPGDLKYQIIAIALWGSQSARADEAPLLTAPDAVLISTVHGVKGLEFPVVFMADVCTRRFPSNRARTPPQVPFNGPILTTVNPAALADDANLNAERRLLYVALTRAERYLFVSTSNPSAFHREVEPFVTAHGGTVTRAPNVLPGAIELLPSEVRRDTRLVTSFSDIRYFLECPHDFYLRKVLGLSPTIDQAFGYGRGVHNILRAIHSDPRAWAALTHDRAMLRARIEAMVNSGLFYLRHTTAEPAENMRRRATEVITEYVLHYADELARLQFEPEREFETLLESEQTLISGAIDVVRLDDPPRISIIDFKSGEPQSDAHALDEEEMRLQVTVYGLAAKHELEYEPDRGLVRYLGGDEAGTELEVDLTGGAIAEARSAISETARSIRERAYFTGPAATANPRERRCANCDFLPFCGMEEARETREALG
jgi:DNA helicase-2/ATP-dependent DNA helicase PcrA